MDYLQRSGIEKDALKRVVPILENWGWIQCASIGGGAEKWYMEISDLEWRIATTKNPYVMVWHVGPRLGYNTKEVLDVCARLKRKRDEFTEEARVYAAVLCLLLKSSNRAELDVDFIKSELKDNGMEWSDDVVEHDPSGGMVSDHPLYTPDLNQEEVFQESIEETAKRVRVVVDGDQAEDDEPKKQKISYFLREELKRLFNNVYFGREDGAVMLQSKRQVQLVVPRTLLMLHCARMSPSERAKSLHHQP